jgi:PAS domain S-box-containing protein
MKHLKQAMSKASDGAFIINKDSRIVFKNQAAESILGYSAERVTGRYCYEVLGWRDEQGRALYQRFCRLARHTLNGETPPNIDLHATTPNDEGRRINVTTLAYPAGDQELGEVIVHMFRDATQRKNAERFLEQIIEMSNELTEEDRQPKFSVIPAETNSYSHLSGLTPREGEVLHLLARGFGTTKIASALIISSSTTRNHIKSILGKLGVHSRLEAVAYAHQHGLTDTTG